MNKLFLCFFSILFLFGFGCSHADIKSERNPAEVGMGSGGTGTGSTGLPDNPCVFHITGTQDSRVIGLVAKKMKKNGYEYNQNSLLNLVILSSGGTGTASGGISSGASSIDFFSPMSTARIKIQLQQGTNESKVYALASAQTEASYGSTNISEALGEAIEKISNCPGILK